MIYLKSVPLGNRREDGYELIGDMRVRRHSAVNVVVFILCQMTDLLNELSVCVSRRMTIRHSYFLCKELAVSSTNNLFILFNKTGNDYK